MSNSPKSSLLVPKNVIFFNSGSKLSKMHFCIEFSNSGQKAYRMIPALSLSHPPATDFPKTSCSNEVGGGVGCALCSGEGGSGHQEKSGGEHHVLNHILNVFLQGSAIIPLPWCLLKLGPCALENWFIKLAVYKT